MARPWGELDAAIKRFTAQRTGEPGPNQGVLVDSADCLGLLADLRDTAREMADDQTAYEQDTFDLIARGLDVILRDLPEFVE